MLVAEKEKYFQGACYSGGDQTSSSGKFSQNYPIKQSVSAPSGYCPLVYVYYRTFPFSSFVPFPLLFGLLLVRVLVLYVYRTIRVVKDGLSSSCIQHPTTTTATRNELFFILHRRLRWNKLHAARTAQRYSDSHRYVSALTQVVIQLDAIAMA